MTLTHVDWLLPALAHIETNLDGDLRIESVAAAVGRSPSHLSRSFSGLLGESPSEHIERLRLERAAVMLKVRKATILEVALDCGYQNHETFTRAFGRRFGVTPSSWRASGSTVAGKGPGVEEGLGVGHLSSTTVQDFQPLWMMFIRHLGSYEDVPADLWARLIAHADEYRIAHLGILVGVAHDSPEVTAARQCRFDAGLLVASQVQAIGRIGYQELAEATHAVTTYVGPYRGIPDAYAVIVGRLAEMGDRIEIVGLPTVELYRTTTITPDASMNQTDIAIPIIRRPH